MSESVMSAEEIREVVAELARASICSLQKIFTTAPGHLSWDKIEARLRQGEPLKDILELSSEYMQSSYEKGKEKLHYQDFPGAREIFVMLCLYDQQMPKYWSALAKCCEALRLYPEALDCYKMLILLTGGSEPLPYMCMGYIYLALRDKASALGILEAGRDICDPYDERHRHNLQLIEKLIKVCKK